MKNINLNIILILVVTFIIVLTKPVMSQVNNDYKWLHPKPQGNSLNWIKMWDANNWYACGAGTTFMKTSDGGNTWEIRNSYLLSDDIKLLDFLDMEFINMNTGYACGSEGKFYKTTNAGETWDSSTVISNSILWYDTYWIDQNTGFLSGTKPTCIAVTTDGGTTWVQPGTPPNYTAYSVFALSPDSILLSCEQGKVSKTTNGGVNWETINAASGGIRLWALGFINDSTGYVCGSSRNVKMTTDFGASWTLLNSGLQNTLYYDIDFATIDDTTYIYVTGSDYAIFRSKVGTNSWDTLSILDTAQEYSGTMFSSDVSVTGDTIISCGTRGFINARYGSSHNKAFTNYIATTFKNDIWSDGMGRIIAVGRKDGDNDQSMYSTDGGNTWQNGIVTGSQDIFYSIAMVNSTTGYASGSGKIFKTTTGGAGWFETSPTGNTDDIYGVSFINENTGWVVGEGGNCYKTTNAGGNWTPFTWGGGTDDALSCCFIDANTGWISGENGTLYKTTDGGASTVPQNINTGLYYVINVDMLNANTGWLTNRFELMKTTNGGTNWDTNYLPYSSLYINDFDFTDEMNGMVIDDDGNVYKTTDGGNSWEVGNVSSIQIEGVYMVSPTEAYICGPSSFVFGYKDIVSGTELTYTNSIPKEHYLEQNYPNPFNPSTTIKFGIPRQGLVSLKVYDMSGREVANLINNRKMNAGQVTQRFDGSSLSSGVYFYSLVVDGELIATKKMVLVK
ncbi:MAG: T9SS type A sorting domain-containing protein [Ignavibacteriae bacterium]|nr:T9SS type A sorting domain-containing protein [Ignavibacteriota bacterium]MCB9243589.1 T9SS type A sorting domain-containing protein [Ignavibacteriales bacterium]